MVGMICERDGLIEPTVKERMGDDGETADNF